MERQSEAPDAVRPPPGNPRFPALDAIRGIAVLTVIAFHAVINSGSQRGFLGGEVMGYLDVGVPIFFTLSAFLLYRPFIAERMNAGRRPRIPVYAKRRLLRILPAFLVAFIGFSIYPGLPGLDQNWWIYAGLLQSFTFLYDPATACGASFCGLQHAWTITVELTFYAVLPAYVALTGLAFKRGAQRGWLAMEAFALVAVAAAGVATYSFFHSNQADWFWVAISLPGVGIWFSAGIALAVLSVLVHDREREYRAVRLLADRPAVPLLGAVAVYALLAAVTTPSGTLGTLGATLARYFAFGAIALLVVSAGVFSEHRTRTTRTHRALLGRPLRWAGLVSYGAYLWQLVVIPVLLLELDMYKLFPGTLPLLLLVVLATAGSLGAGALSYYLVERSFLRFKYRALPWKGMAQGAPRQPGADVESNASEEAPESVAAPPGNPRFELIDSMRGLAALTIVLIHSTISANAYSTTWVGRHIIGHLSVAVPMFLAISGFLLYRPFISWREGGPRIGLGGYGWRRFLRVVPGLWAALTIYGLIYLLIEDGTSIIDLNIFSDHWWVYYGLLGGQTYLYDPASVCSQTFCFFGPTWSLALEVMLYALVLPVYMAVIHRLTARRDTATWVRAEIAGLILLSIVTLAGAAYYADGHENLVWLNFNPLTQALPFLAGMGLAVASVAISITGRHRLTERLGSSGRWTVPLAVVLFGVVAAAVPPFGSLLTVPERMVEYILDAAIVTLLMIPAVFTPSRDGLWRRVLALPFLAWIGVVSYGIFLWHAPFSQFLVDAGALTWFPGKGTYVIIGATFATAIAAGAVSYYVIERPFLRLKRLTFGSRPDRDSGPTG